MPSASKQYQTVAEASPNCLWEWDLQTNEIWRSERFTQVFGWQTGNVDSRADAWHNRIHPDDREAVLSRLRQVLDGGGEWTDTYRFQRADGSYAYVSDQGFTIPTTSKPMRITGYLTDVSDRVLPPQESPETEEDRSISPNGANEQELSTHIEKHLPTAFTNASVGLVVAYPDGRFRQVNQAFGNITGYSTAELETSTYALLMHPDDLPRYQSELTERTGNGAGPLVAQVRCLHKDGHVVWISLHITLVYDEAGRLESLFSVVQDITQDVATRDEQQKLLTLVDSSLSFMAIADLGGRLTYINKAGRALVGLDTTDGFERINVADFYTPEQYGWLMEVPIPTLLSRGHWSGRLKLRHFKTGEAIPCYANGIRIDDPDTGQPIAVGAVMRNMRPERLAQQALLESEERFRSMIMQAPIAICLLRGEQLVVESAK